jgi:cysteine desulfurase
VDPEDILKAVTDKTILVAVMYANNEIGTIQPIREIGKITKTKGIPFLVDSVQAVGHIPVDVNDLPCDLLSLSAHKFYGPKGVGALYIREGTRVAAFLHGGGQERGRRASTQNVAGAVGLAKAVELCQQTMDKEAHHQTAWRRRLIEEILKRIEGAHLNGHPSHRLPNNVNFSFEGIDGESLIMSLDMLGIAASQGSACTSGAMEPSHVLRAIGLPDELAHATLRITLGRWTTSEHIEYLLNELPGIVKRLRI